MNVENLLAGLRARGAVFTIVGDHLRVKAPPRVLTQEAREALARHKAEIMTLLTGTQPSAPPCPVPRMPTPPADPAAGLTAESFADFAAIGQVVTIQSRTLSGPIYLVPDDAEARRLVEDEGVPRHRIYTPTELAEHVGLFTLGPAARAAALRALDAAREVFGDVEVVAVRRPAPPGRPEPGPAQLDLDGPEAEP